MCRNSDLRIAVTTAHADGQWFTTFYYGTVGGMRSFVMDQRTHQATSWGPELEDGKEEYYCVACDKHYPNEGAALQHLDADPNEDWNILRMFGLR